jgi:hypothetical protein
MSISDARTPVSAGARATLTPQTRWRAAATPDSCAQCAPQ